MKRILGILLALFALATPAMAVNSYYFSDCGWTPDATWRPLIDYFTQVCAGNATQSDTTSCHKYCQGIFPSIYCTDECVGAGAVASFGCGGAAPTSGGITNPWCLSPEISASDCTSNGHPSSCCTAAGVGATCAGYLRNSFGAMSDGGAGHHLTTELAAGDTVYLCAGACDGNGSATWYVQPTSGGNFLVPQVAGSNGSPITIRPYCAGNFCENVTLVGDSNNDGAHQSGEVNTWLSDATASPIYWTFDGDPLNRGQYNIALKRYNGQGFDLSNRVPHDFTLHGIEMQGDSPEIWSGQDMGPLQDSSHSPFCGQNGHYGLHVDNWTTGTISITGNYFHDFCSFALRHNLNTTQAANALMNVKNNVFENVGAVAINNTFSLRSIPASSIYTFSGNLMKDSGPTTWSDNYEHVVVTDNDYECLGLHGSNAVGGCGGIVFTNGSQQKPSCIKTCTNDITKDCGGWSGSQCNDACGGTDCSTSCTGPSDCAMDDILIARNRIRATATPVGNPGDDMQHGGMETGITVNGYYDHGAATSWPTGFTIENNMISNLKRRYSSSNVCQANTEAPNSAALAVSTRTNGTVIRNNTIYGCDAPLMICNDSGTPTGTVSDNLIYASTSSPEVQEQTGAALTFTNNDISHGTTTGNVIAIGCAADFSGCSTTACSGVTAFSTNSSSGNICSAATFAYTAAGAQAIWDLHLSGSQLCIDAGTSCSTLDFDSQTRPAIGCDIGADELCPGGCLADPTVVVLPTIPPAVSAAPR